MNRTIVRFTGAAVAAAAVLALSAPVFADGGHGRGGHFSTGGQNANGGDRGGNRGGGNSGGNRGGGGNQANGGSGGRSNSDSGRYSGGSRYHGTSSAEQRANSGGGAPRYGNGASRPGNGGARNIEGAEPVNSSRYRSRMPSGGAINGGVTERNLSNSNLPNPVVANGNPGGSSFRSDRNRNGQLGPRGGVITQPRGNFANDRSSGNRSSGDRHYATPHVPGIPASGRYSYLDRGNRPGFVHSRPSRVWYGNRPYWGWNGGYWRGSYWPRAYYRPGFVGFVTLLPPVYSTYWYGGVSYYYANDLYYTWDPNRYGYAVANPPPIVEEASSYSTAPDADDQDEGQGPGSLYVYPRNGQSEEQTAQDRFECHQWAVDQTGFDPTVGEAQSSSAGSSDDYHRAIIACLDGRGYSAN